MTDKPPPVTASLGFGISTKAKPVRSRKEEPAPQQERRPRILLVDADAESRRFAATRLTLANYNVETVDSAAAALDACVRSRPNLVITDLNLGPMDGQALLTELKIRWPAVTVIIVTSHGTIAQAVQATQSGAFGFLVKPVGKAELLGQVQRAIATSTFTEVEGNWRSQIVARSELMQNRLGQANRAAASDAPVLLTGESGTGKELLARAIHAASPRRDKPFVTVHCKDIGEDPLELELFGRRGPASEGHHTLGLGAIDAAQGGTLLIDEIGCLPLRLQAQLAAVLSKPSRHADEAGGGCSGGPGDGPAHGAARLICTTSLELQELTKSGEFRRELFEHINKLSIEIPPLGRRREDIPLLVSHFLEQASEPGGGKKIYTPEAIELLATTDWPGNVCQLFELVKQNVALSNGKVMSKEFVAGSLGGTVKKVLAYDEAREDFARTYLTSNLQATSGNISQSARLAKRNRTDFYKLLARYRVQADDFKQASPAEPPGIPAPPLDPPQVV